MEKKIEKGDKVIYKGVLAVVDKVGETFSGEPTLDLTSADDEEMTCTAITSECELYNETEFDKESNDEALRDARLNSRMVLGMIDGLTDKYIGDCSY